MNKQTTTLIPYEINFGINIEKAVILVFLQTLKGGYTSYKQFWSSSMGIEYKDRNVSEQTHNKCLPGQQK